MSIDDAIRRSGRDQLRCPNDDTRLVEIERSGIMIDACPECRGIWLDRGELDRLLERERRVSQNVLDDDDDFFQEMEGRRRQRAPRDARDDPRDDPRDRKRRKRGLLEDLFDVFD